MRVCQFRHFGISKTPGSHSASAGVLHRARPRNNLGTGVNRVHRGSLHPSLNCFSGPADHSGMQQDCNGIGAQRSICAAHRCRPCESSSRTVRPAFADAAQPILAGRAGIAAKKTAGPFDPAQWFNLVAEFEALLHRDGEGVFVNRTRRIPSLYGDVARTTAERQSRANAGGVPRVLRHAVNVNLHRRNLGG